MPTINFNNVANLRAIEINGLNTSKRGIETAITHLGKDRVKTGRKSDFIFNKSTGDLIKTKTTKDDFVTTKQYFDNKVNIIKKNPDGEIIDMRLEDLAAKKQKGLESVEALKETNQDKYAYIKSSIEQRRSIKQAQ